MVENLYVAERLGREKVEELVREADQQRLQRTATEAVLPAARNVFSSWLAGRSPSTPAPRRA